MPPKLRVLRIDDIRSRSICCNRSGTLAYGTFLDVRFENMQGTSLNHEAGKKLDGLLAEIEEELGADVLTLLGPIRDGVEFKVRDALEPLSPKRHKLAVVIQTNGGLVEVVERIVHIIRYFYQEVVFIVPDKAMSAGTVFVMSGDAIMMDYFSCLGPIDPQVVRDDISFRRFHT